MTHNSETSANRKLWQKLLVGALVGGGVTGMLLSIVGDRAAIREPGVMLAIMAGLCYCLMGAIVGIGLLVPRAGARFLNVADADEIADERAKLAPSALSCILVGLFFLGLALAPALPIGRDALALVLGLCVATVAAITIPATRHSDELTKRISTEASALTLHLALVLFGGWAALAHLGMVTWISPLAFLAGLALLMLLAIFWVGSRRGLLSARSPDRVSHIIT